jgi:hypothetical protein
MAETPLAAIDPLGNSTVQAARSAFKEYLGLKKYRRTLSLALSKPSPARPEKWQYFVYMHPEFELTDEQFQEMITYCVVHECALTQRIVRGNGEDVTLNRDPTFHQARVETFPHSYPITEIDSERERIVWSCLHCQRAREAWMAARAEHEPASPESSYSPSRGLFRNWFGERGGVPVGL